MRNHGAPRPKSHQSGDFGERLVASVLPPEWVLHTYKGSEDYGIDVHVEIFVGGRPTGLEFGIQVKTIQRLPAKRRPKVHITRNNLLYMASKTYPTMIALASQRDRRVVFTWIGEIFTTVDEVISAVGDLTDGTKKLSLALSPHYDLAEEASGIVDYASRVKENLGFWYKEEQNRRQLIDLYLDMHAAFDVLIELTCVSKVTRFEESKYSDTITIVMMLMLTCYFTLNVLSKFAGRNNPALAAIVVFRNRLRSIIAKIVPEDDLKARENERDGQEKNDIQILPASAKEMYSNIYHLTWVFRDGLRGLSVYLAAWRDFSLGASGLAASAIDFNTKRQPV